MTFNSNEITQRAAEFVANAKSDPELPPELKPFEKILPALVADKDIVEANKVNRDFVKQYVAYQKETGLDMFDPSFDKAPKEQQIKMLDLFDQIGKTERIFKDKIEAKMDKLIKGFDDVNAAQVQNYVFDQLNHTNTVQANPVINQYRENGQPLSWVGHHHDSFIPPATPAVPQDSTKKDKPR